jgi:hypothetical protein
VGIWQELDRQEALRRDRQRRRIRRRGLAMLLGWAGIGLLGLISGDPEAIVPGLVFFVIGTIGAVLFYRSIAREPPIEDGDVGTGE